MNFHHGNSCVVPDCRETGNAGFFSLPKNNEERKFLLIKSPIQDHCDKGMGGKKEGGPFVRSSSFSS